VRFVGAVIVALSVGSGCTFVADRGRCAESLRARGFTDIRCVGVSVHCPWYYDSCTAFESTAPWGWKVGGTVACGRHGTCDTYVVFE